MFADVCADIWTAFELAAVVRDRPVRSIFEGGGVIMEDRW